MNKFDIDTGNSAQLQTDEASQLLNEIDNALASLDRSGLVWDDLGRALLRRATACYGRAKKLAERLDAGARPLVLGRLALLQARLAGERWRRDESDPYLNIARLEMWHGLRRPRRVSVTDTELVASLENDNSD